MTEWPFQRVSRCGFAALFLVVSSSVGFGQVIAVSAAASPLMTEFTAEQSALDAQVAQMMQGSASDTQLSYWMEENQAALLGQQALAIQLGIQAASQTFAAVPSLSLPTGTSSDLSDFISVQCSLANLTVQIHNQLVQQGIVSGDAESTLLVQQAGGTLQSQQQLAQQLAGDEAQQTLPMPPPLSIPPNASPQDQAFLTLVYQLSSGEIQVHNANVNASKAVSDAAEQQWQQENAANFQQLQQLAQPPGAASTSPLNSEN